MARRTFACLYLLALCAWAYSFALVRGATTRYVSQSGGLFSGGSQCNGHTAISVATFNGTGQSAGDTNYLCGNLTSVLTPSGNGSSGNVVSIIFDTGANITVSSCGTNGYIDLNGLSYYLVDGSPTATPCGYVSQGDVACNGLKCRLRGHWRGRQPDVLELCRA